MLATVGPQTGMWSTGGKHRQYSNPLRAKHQVMPVLQRTRALSQQPSNPTQASANEALIPEGGRQAACSLQHMLDDLRHARSVPSLKG